MASDTMVTFIRRRERHKKAGRKRKNKESKRSTLSAKEIFAALGQPGKE